MEVHLQPLDAAAFAPFGAVFAPTANGNAANAGMAQRYDHLVALANARPAARPNLALFDVRQFALPLTVTALERHPYSTQTFVPMRAARFAVVVCPALSGGGPDATGLRAFAAAPDVGVHYHAGTWHHAIVALDAPARFAALVWEDGTAGDCVEVTLDSPVIVRQPA